MLTAGLVLGLCGLTGLHAYTCFYYQKLVPGVKYSIASPGWPVNYQSTESCQWVAEAPPDQRVALECDEFSLPGLHNNESRSCCDVLYASENGAPVGRDGMPFVGHGVMVTTSNILNVELRTSTRSATEGRFRCYLTATQEHQWEVVNRASLDPPQTQPQQEPCLCGQRLEGRVSALGRITGGSDVKPNEFPVMAALAEGSSVLCGAVLVSSRHALTSAHCLRGKVMEVVDLVVGDYDFSLEPDGTAQQKHKLADFIKHPSWSNDWSRANIAVAKTKEEVRLNFFVTPACMPSRSAEPQMTPGDRFLALGWGSETYDGNTSTRLKYMRATLQENKECESKYQTTLQDEHFCIGSNKGQAVCSGDPGGPILAEDPKTHRLTVIGIMAVGEGCTGAPIINTKVYSYLDWIREQTGDSICSPMK